jgi:ERCC4-type nuclease
LSSVNVGAILGPDRVEKAPVRHHGRRRQTTKNDRLSHRGSRQLTSELDAIPGVGAKTVQKLLKEFGSSELVRAAAEDRLAAVVGRAAARKVRAHYGRVAARE